MSIHDTGQMSGTQSYTYLPDKLSSMKSNHFEAAVINYCNAKINIFFLYFEYFTRNKLKKQT